MRPRRRRACDAAFAPQSSGICSKHHSSVSAAWCWNHRGRIAAAHLVRPGHLLRETTASRTRRGTIPPPRRDAAPFLCCRPRKQPARREPRRANRVEAGNTIPAGFVREIGGAIGVECRGEYGSRGPVAFLWNKDRFRMETRKATLSLYSAVLPVAGRSGGRSTGGRASMPAVHVSAYRRSQCH